MQLKNTDLKRIIDSTVRISLLQRFENNGGTIRGWPIGNRELAPLLGSELHVKIFESLKN